VVGVWGCGLQAGLAAADRGGSLGHEVDGQQLRSGDFGAGNRVFIRSVVSIHNYFLVILHCTLLYNNLCQC
jgi:hypothetical protein